MSGSCPDPFECKYRHSEKDLLKHSIFRATLRITRRCPVLQTWYKPADAHYSPERREEKKWSKESVRIPQQTELIIPWRASRGCQDVHSEDRALISGDDQKRKESKTVHWKARRDKTLDSKQALTTWPEEKPKRTAFKWAFLSPAVFRDTGLCKFFINT